MNLMFLKTTHLLLVFCFIITTTSSSTTHKLARGFSASPPSTFAFHPLLTDPTSTFSFGFLPSPPSVLRLAVLHLPSSTPLWLSPASATWHPSTTLLFNGSLLLVDPPSTFHLTPPGDLLLLLPTSNLQLTTSTSTTVWQSFDHPSHTIVQDQNFTSNFTLSSPNHRFYMSLGSNFIGLYMNSSSQVQPPLYFKETALEFRAHIVPGKGPLYARVNASGYLGLYQGEDSLVHLVPFSTYQRSIDAFWRLTMEDNGNLRGHYWNGTSWVVGYEAVKEFCDLPSGCGAYGLCVQEGTTGRCTCLDNETSYEEGKGCEPRETGLLCGDEEGGGGEYRVVSRTGVALAYKEYLGYTTVASMEECEGRCERNCSCWGVIYGNATGACYVMDFPVETVVEEGGDGRVGYFKVRKRRHVEGKGGASKAVVAELVAGGLVVGGLVLWGVVLCCRARRRRRRRGVEGMATEGLPRLPYKWLRESPSFRAVEMSAVPK